MKRLTVIIPVYNEEATIAALLTRVADEHVPGYEKEIIVVDDGSVDDSISKIPPSLKLPPSPKWLRRPSRRAGKNSREAGQKFLRSRISLRETKIKDSDTTSFQLISLQQNHGKGYAVRQAFKQATGDIILIQDADLEYSPSDWGR